MPVVRSIVSDLREKRLWPVALILVAALVGVPVLLGRGAGPPESPPRTLVAQGDRVPRSSPAAVRVESAGPVRRERPGRLRNPFRKSATATAGAGQSETVGGSSATTGASGSGGQAQAAPSGGGSTGGAAPQSEGGGVTTIRKTPESDGSGRPQSPAGEDGGGQRDAGGQDRGGQEDGAQKDGGDRKNRARRTYRIDVRLGPARDGDAPKAIDDLPRLAALPSSDDPLLVFLGVLAGGRTAVFLISPAVTPSPRDACRPAPESCQTIELSKGARVRLDVAAQDGAPGRQYQLKLVRIARRKASGGSTRRSTFGAQLLRNRLVRGSDVAGARAYRFLPDDGVVVRAKRERGRRGRVAWLAPLLPWDDQPGVPVWRSRPRQR